MYGIRTIDFPVTFKPADVLPPGLPDGSHHTYRNGDAVYQDGDASEHYYEVVSGAVRVCKLLTDGRRQVIAFYLQGDLFGFDDLYGCHSLSAEAVANCETVVTRRLRRRLDNSAAADPGLAGRLRELAFRDLLQSRAHLIMLGTLDAVERVAAFLADMSERLAVINGYGSAGDFLLPMGRRDIADYLGITPETLSRSLRTLRDRGVVALSGSRRVRILNWRELSKLDDVGPSTCERSVAAKRGFIPAVSSRAAWTHERRLLA